MDTLCRVWLHVLHPWTEARTKLPAVPSRDGILFNALITKAGVVEKKCVKKLLSYSLLHLSYNIACYIRIFCVHIISFMMWFYVSLSHDRSVKDRFDEFLSSPYKLFAYRYTNVTCSVTRHSCDKCNTGMLHTRIHFKAFDIMSNT